MMRNAKRKPKGPPVVINDRTLTTAQVKLLKSAAAASFEGRDRDAAELYRALERQLGDGNERAWLKSALDEIIALESLRGESIEISDKPEHKGRVRILTRDGLERLRYPGDTTKLPAIGANQYSAGLRYRDQFERIAVSLRSCMAGTLAGGGSPAGAADRAASAKALVKAWDDAVFASFRVARDGHDALLAIREVAGWGRSLRDLSTSGRRQGVLRDRLCQALDVVADMLALH